MSDVPNCPKCESTFTYLDRDIFTCPECAHEWSEADAKAAEAAKDSNGTVLENGDNVTVIKDLKLKGSSQVVKVGTKVRNIRLVDSDHNIDCKIDGIGQMGLKSEFVRKVT
jgi:protein PhnA